MFNLRNFIMTTLEGMKGNYPDFQIREYALNWYGKGKLTEDDLSEIEGLINPSADTEETEEPDLGEGNLEEPAESEE